MLKQLTSISLLLIMLLSIFGYYGLVLIADKKYNQKIMVWLDNEMEENIEFLSKKIPLAIPYQSGRSEFERLDGLVEIEGQVHRVVKARFENDTLTILYMVDHRQTKINNAYKRVAENFSEHQDESNDNTTLLKMSSKEYLPVSMELETKDRGWVKDIQFGFLDNRFVSFVPEISSPPPQS